MAFGGSYLEGIAAKLLTRDFRTHALDIPWGSIHELEVGHLLWASAEQVGAMTLHLVTQILSNRVVSDLPAMHDDEETADDGTSYRVRVQLAYPGYEHRPSYTTQETVHIGIDRSPCSVQSDVFYGQQDRSHFVPIA